MTKKEIEINKAFIKKGIDMSLVSAENLETGDRPHPPAPR